MATTGFHEHTVYHAESTKFVCSSGGEIEVESNGKLSLKAGSRMEFSSVNETSAVNLKLDFGGVSIINPTTAWLSTSTGANAFIDEPPAAGIQKTIIIHDTTKVVEVAASSSKLRHFASSSTQGHTLKIEPTTESKRLGCRVDLMSLSTAMWNVSMPTPLMASSGWDGQATVTTSTLN